MLCIDAVLILLIAERVWNVARNGKFGLPKSAGFREERKELLGNRGIQENGPDCCVLISSSGQSIGAGASRLKFKQRARATDHMI
jgi:hypothetical protein